MEKQKQAQTRQVAKNRHVSANICNWLINNKILYIIKYSKCKAYSSEAYKQTTVYMCVCVCAASHVQVTQKICKHPRRGGNGPWESRREMPAKRMRVTLCKGALPRAQAA